MRTCQLALNRKLIGMLGYALLLAACDTVPKNTERPVVNIQVPVPCVDQGTPRAPKVSSNAELAALADDTLVLTMARERLLLLTWAGEVSPVLEACRVLP